MKARKARLDADRTAKPRTRLVAHVPEGKRIVGHQLVERYELKDVDPNEAEAKGQKR